MRKLSRICLIALAKTAILLGNTQAAFAHTVLISSSPAKNAKISALPSKITLTFAEALLTIKGKNINSVAVSDSVNHNLVTASAQVNGAVVSAALIPASKLNGKFLVSYRVVADDGHVVTGSFTFTVIGKK